MSGAGRTATLASLTAAKALPESHAENGERVHGKSHPAQAGFAQLLGKASRAEAAERAATNATPDLLATTNNAHTDDHGPSSESAASVLGQGA